MRNLPSRVENTLKVIYFSRFSVQEEILHRLKRNLVSSRILFRVFSARLNEMSRRCGYSKNIRHLLRESLRNVSCTARHARARETSLIVENAVEPRAQISAT